MVKTGSGTGEKTTPADRMLDIYVTTHCFGSDRAWELSEQVRAWEIPHLSVRVIDLAAPGTTRPEQVFAVPTYLLDGRVLCLGTPEPEWLLHRLTSETGAGA